LRGRDSAAAQGYAALYQGDSASAYFKPRRILMLDLTRCFLLAVACFALPLNLFSQGFSQAPSTSPPGLVDGSKNPELIPDSAAYRLVFISLMAKTIPDSGDPKALARRNAALHATGLSSGDQAVLIQELAGFSEQYKSWQTQLAGPANAASRKAQVASLVLATRNALIKQLSPDGAATFVSYVQARKSRMVVRP
jgi:hypothetical protein